MKIPHLLLLLLAILFSSTASAETFSPKIVLGWQSTYGGDLTMDPAGQCAADGHWEITNHDAATDQYTCTSKSGFGSYYWNKVTGCPTSYVETGNTDPAKACVYVDTEPPGNCASKAGQQTQLEQQCGLAHCPSGTTWSWSDTSHVYMGCSNGEAPVVTDLTAPPSTSIGGCAVTLKSVDRSHQYGDESFIGSSNSMSATCDYNYEFTGADAPSNDTNPSPGGSSGGDKPKVGGNNGGNNGGDNPGDGGGDNGGDNPGDGGGDGGDDPCVPTPEKPCPGTGNGGGDGDNPGDPGDGTPGGEAPIGDITDIKAPKVEEIKSWWDSKYPDGIKGEWDDKKDQIQQTALGTFLQNWGIPDAGSCPSWSFNLDRLGTHELQPPCYIWPLIRAIFYFCTALLVRRLIFGG